MLTPDTTYALLSLAKRYRRHVRRCLDLGLTREDAQALWEARDE